jgi:hypothetical protein
MSDPKVELLRRMRQLLDSLDPDVVRRLDLAKEGKVPFDRETAHDAVRRYLEAHPDGARLAAQLRRRSGGGSAG